jgi:hypothetical protein
MSFMAVDESLQKQMLDAQRAAAKKSGGEGTKKKAQRSKTSPNPNTPQSVESASV